MVTDATLACPCSTRDATGPIAQHFDTTHAQEQPRLRLLPHQAIKIHFASFLFYFHFPNFFLQEQTKIKN
jgi:hypothetical protein